MKKASSRIKRSSTSTLSQEKTSRLDFVANKKSKAKPAKKKARSRFKAKKKSTKPSHNYKLSLSIFNSKLFKTYLKLLPTLFLSLPFYYATYYILTNIYPSQIKNFILVNTYLPLQLSLFAANFFFFSFLFLKSRRGFLTSLYIGILLFLKLQSVIIDNFLVLGILLVLVIIEISLNYFDKK